MVQISNKFIADLKAFSDLDLRLKEFNSFAGMKKIAQTKVPKLGQKRGTKRRKKSLKKEQNTKNG